MSLTSLHATSSEGGHLRVASSRSTPESQSSLWLRATNRLLKRRKRRRHSNAVNERPPSSTSTVNAKKSPKSRRAYPEVAPVITIHPPLLRPPVCARFSPLVATKCTVRSPYRVPIASQSAALNHSTIPAELRGDTASNWGRKREGERDQERSPGALGTSSA